MSNPKQIEGRLISQSRFWLGPLLAGSFFAFGYGITNYLFRLASHIQAPETLSFTEVIPFPGERLNTLRLRHGDPNVLASPTSNHTKDEKLLVTNNKSATKTNELTSQASQKPNSPNRSILEKLVMSLENPESSSLTPNQRALIKSINLEGINNESSNNSMQIEILNKLLRDLEKKTF